jgi:hypothetical protein
MNIETFQHTYDSFNGNTPNLLAFIQVGTARIEGTHVRRGWAVLEPRTLQSPGSAWRHSGATPKVDNLRRGLDTPRGPHPQSV